MVTRVGRLAEEVPEIQRAMQAGRNRGKIVVRMSPGPRGRLRWRKALAGARD